MTGRPGMQIATPDALIEALHASKLFTPERLAVIMRDVASHKETLPALVKYLIEQHHISGYQLKKVLNGKTAELFIGPYVITDKLGEGGMGRVFRAQHIRMGREVALKVVRPNLLTNPVIRGRYLREVEAAGTLKHPNIVCVEDAGEANGKYYMAMEFVDGVDLARLVRDHRAMGSVEACEYIRQAALGLQHAHESGFVHRDIKPSNIIVAGERHVPQAKNPAFVKILDMGLVRPLGFDDVPGSDELTRQGTVVGTPDFMAPEQAKNSSTVDHRADLYSLGCTLYFLLAGKPPYPDGTPIEKLLKHQLDPPPSIKAVRPDVPDEVEAVINALMAKKPEDRFPSAAMVAEVLAPLAVYAQGMRTQPVPVWRTQPVPVGETMPQGPPSTVRGAIALPGSSGHGTGPQAIPMPLPLPPNPPVAPGDHTPRPLGVPGPLPTSEGSSPFAALDEPSSEPLQKEGPNHLNEAEQHPAKRSSRLPWFVAGGLALAALVVVGLVIKQATKPPTQAGPGNEPPPKNDPPPKPVVRTAIVPKLDLTKFHSLQNLIPDNSGLVVITYPSTYLKNQESPYAKVGGVGKITSWAKRAEIDTSLPLARADRVVVSFQATNPDRFLLVAEGEFAHPNFVATIASNPKLVQPQFAKFDLVYRSYDASGGRSTAYVTPSNGPPLYAVSSDRPLEQRLRGLVWAFRPPPPPRVDEAILASLNAISGETQQPLLLAVVGGGYHLPLDESPTLKDFGIDLAVLKLSIHDKLELELMLAGADRDAIREGLKDLAQRFRDEHPTRGGDYVNDLLRLNGTGETLGGRYRWTIKTTWTPELLSAFLDRALP